MSGLGILPVSYLAGALTTLNPCILPLLPILVASAARAGRSGPLVLIGAMVVSFTLFGSLIAAATLSAGLSTEALRMAAAIILIVLGTIMLIPAFEQRFQAMLSPGAGRIDVYVAERDDGGLKGQILAGLLLGAIWTPCSGPALGGAVALAVESGEIATAALRMFVFALGTATVLLAFTYASRSVLNMTKLRTLAGNGKRVMAIIFVIMGLLVLFGIDKIIEIEALKLLPEWLQVLTVSY